MKWLLLGFTLCTQPADANESAGWSCSDHRVTGQPIAAASHPACREVAKGVAMIEIAKRASGMTRYHLKSYCMPSRPLVGA